MVHQRPMRNPTKKSINNPHKGIKENLAQSPSRQLNRQIKSILFHYTLPGCEPMTWPSHRIRKHHQVEWERHVLSQANFPANSHLSCSSHRCAPIAPKKVQQFSPRYSFCTEVGDSSWGQTSRTPSGPPPCSPPRRLLARYIINFTI